ncbi:MAG: hypothetical protein FJ304_14975 [Planctomycetes bacterium]|nr:hypothetical protein [Planctomycetota bacterium]
MTPAEEFQRRLDADPMNWEAWLAFADRLVAEGDPRGLGYRALTLLRRHPAYFDKVQPLWVWMNGRYAPYYSYRGEEINRALLPDDWYDLIPRSQAPNGGTSECAIERTNFVDALDDAALAFAQLPAERRTELLSLSSASG